MCSMTVEQIHFRMKMILRNRQWIYTLGGLSCNTKVHSLFGKCNDSSTRRDHMSNDDACMATTIVIQEEIEVTMAISVAI